MPSPRNHIRTAGQPVRRAADDFMLPSGQDLGNVLFAVAGLFVLFVATMALLS